MCIQLTLRNRTSREMRETNTRNMPTVTKNDTIAHNTSRTHKADHQGMTRIPGNPQTRDNRELE